MTALSSTPDRSGAAGSEGHRAGRPSKALRIAALTTVLGAALLGTLAWLPHLWANGGPGADDEQPWPVSAELGRDSFPAYERVVLVTIDTLRADHVSCYGYERATTPFLDALAKEGVLFESAIASTSHTAPSHATMLTGLPPAVHGVLRNGERLPESAVELAGLFGQAGYETAAFLGVRFLTGIASGFDHVFVRPVGSSPARAALRWLEQPDLPVRFFLWLHVYDPHRWRELEAVPRAALRALRRDDTLPPQEIARRVAERHGLPSSEPWGSEVFSARIDNPGEVVELEIDGLESFLEVVDSYDARIRSVDADLERLYRAIEARRLPGASLWIVTSDHGEGLGSHGYAGHGALIYQEQLRVPLVFHATDGSLEPRRVPNPVQLADLFPTLAEVLGARLGGFDEELLGASLRPLLLGEEGWVDRPAFSQRRPDDERPSAGDLFALQTGLHKYILDTEGADEFYDLEADPRELEDLSELPSPERDALRALLEARLEAYRRLRGGERGSEAGPMPREWLEELRALGYMR